MRQEENQELGAPGSQEKKMSPPSSVLLRGQGSKSNMVPVLCQDTKGDPDSRDLSPVCTIGVGEELQVRKTLGGSWEYDKK